MGEKRRARCVLKPPVEAQSLRGFLAGFFRVPSAARIVRVAFHTCLVWGFIFMLAGSMLQMANSQTLPAEIPYSEVELAVQAEVPGAMLNTNYLAVGGGIVLALFVAGLSFRLLSYLFRSASNTNG